MRWPIAAVTASGADAPASAPISASSRSPTNGEPAPAGQRREQHIALRGGDQRRAVPGQPAAHGDVGHQRGARVGRAGQVLRPSNAGSGCARRPPRSPTGPRSRSTCPSASPARRPRGRRSRSGTPPRRRAARSRRARPAAGQQLLGPPLRQAALELPAAARAGERRLADAAERRGRRAGRSRGAPSWPAPGPAGPAWCRISSVAGCSAVARACRCGRGCCSTTRLGTPWRASSTAENSPDGPAPIDQHGRPGRIPHEVSLGNGPGRAIIRPG